MDKIVAKLKYKTEDFIVEEIQDKWHCQVSKDFVQPEIRIDTSSERDFLLCELEKRDIDHFSAIKIIANFLGKNTQAIGYAGTKDKQAYTSQRISIERPDIKKLLTFKHPNLILKNFKWSKRKIKMGYLDSNHFKITLRDIDKKDAMKISNQIRKTKTFPNYFGPQRFGKQRGNIKIGKAILKRNFRKAIELIYEDREYAPYDSEREPLAELKSIPRKNLLMYVHSVQSAIFNEIVSQAIEERLDMEERGQQSGILAGYKTRFSNGRLGQIEQEILTRHNLKLEDFDVKEISFLRIKGSFRKAVTRIEDMSILIFDDEEFSNSKKIELTFTLPSGVYATTFLENFFEFE